MYLPETVGRHWQWWCCYWSHHHPLEVSFSKFPSKSPAGSESLHVPDTSLQSRIWARVWRIPSLYHSLRPGDYTTDNRVLSRHNTGSVWLVTVQSVIKIQDTAPSPPHISANTGHFSPGLTYNRLKIPTTDDYWAIMTSHLCNFLGHHDHMKIN